MRSGDQPKDVVPQELRLDRRRALLRHLQARPDLCALVRELDHPVGAADQHAPLFWALARTLRRSPVLSTLTILPLPSKTKPALALPVSLTTLAVSSRLSPIRAPLARLADWVGDLPALTRLDISTSGEAHSLRPMLDGARLPNLVDLRITSEQRRDDAGHVEAILRALGPQLRTLHLFDLSGRRPHTPDVRALCPALEELALDYLRPMPTPRTGTVVHPPAMGDFDLLLFGSPWRRPSDDASPEPTIVLSRTPQQDVLAAACSLRPRRVALAALDLRRCAAVDRASARELAHDVFKRAGGARLEDRFGRAVVGGEVT